MDIDLQRNAVREHTSSASLAMPSRRVVVVAVAVAVAVGVVVVYKMRLEGKKRQAGQLGQAMTDWSAGRSRFLVLVYRCQQLQLSIHSFMAVNSIVNQVILRSSGPESSGNCLGYLQPRHSNPSAPGHLILSLALLLPGWQSFFSRGCGQEAGI